MGMYQKSRLIFLLFTVFILKSAAVFAQSGAFKYKAAVQKIDSSGVYKIELDPAVIAKSVQSLYDVRLMDNTGKFVAYALSNHLTIDSGNDFIEFPEVKQRDNADTATTFIAENKNKFNVNQLLIELKNTSVSRSVNIAGSDDLNKWYAIKEDIDLQPASYGDKPEYQQSFTFPTSNYRYFKLQVNGKNKTPIKILQAGISIENSIKPEFAVLPSAHFDSKDTAKMTRVFIHFESAYQINKLHFTISEPKYYSRRVVVYIVSRNTDGTHTNEICDTVLNSTGTQDILLTAKANRLQLDIFNGDDNPLKIISITGYQLKQYAISYLESGHDYYLLTGCAAAKPVDYDLSFLKYRAFNLLPVIKLDSIEKNQAYAIAGQVVKRNYTPLLWAAIALVLILLSFLTFKMVGEIKAKG
jgi:hypothetical protein